MSRALLLFILTGFLVIVLPGCEDDDDYGPEPIWDAYTTATTYNELNRFVEFIDKAGLKEKLSDPEAAYTVFPPRNGSFEKYNLDTMSADQVRDFMEYHIIEGKILKKDNMQAQHQVKTMGGDYIYIESIIDSIYINEDATISHTNVKATNGYLHPVINSVLIPDKYQTVYAILDKNYNLKKFQKWIRETELTSPLINDTKYTVFAAWQKAFVNYNLPEDDSELVALFEYHIVPGVYRTSDLVDGQTLQTYNGKEITIQKTEDDEVYVNGEAKILIADSEGHNGVLHVVNKILEPPANN